MVRGINCMSRKGNWDGDKSRDPKAVGLSCASLCSEEQGFDDFHAKVWEFFH